MSENRRQRGGIFLTHTVYILFETS